MVVMLWGKRASGNTAVDFENVGLPCEKIVCKVGLALCIHNALSHSVPYLEVHHEDFAALLVAQRHLVRLERAGARGRHGGCAAGRPQHVGQQVGDGQGIDAHAQPLCMLV